MLAFLLHLFIILVSNSKLSLPCLSFIYQKKAVMVNGIQASCYVALQKDNDEYAMFQGGIPFVSQQTGIHWVLSPFRMLCRVDSFGFCHSYNHDGIPYYISNGIEILQWAEKQHLIFQIILFIPAFVIFGVLMVMENVFFPLVSGLHSLRIPYLIFLFFAIYSGVNMSKVRENKAKVN